MQNAVFQRGHAKSDCNALLRNRKLLGNRFNQQASHLNRICDLLAPSALGLVEVM
jgi:hypothetical protein